MNKKDLLANLKPFKPTDEVFVSIFFRGHAELVDIHQVCENGGAQLSVDSDATGDGRTHLAKVRALLKRRQTPRGHAYLMTDRVFQAELDLVLRDAGV